MNDLTVLIPSIGRNSVLQSIKSIDVDCNIRVLTTGDIDPDLSILLGGYHDKKIEYSHFPERLSVGLAKQYLIKTVDTKYFVILDDDDVFTPGFLRGSLELFKLDESLHWIMTGFDRSSDSYAIYDVPDKQTLYDKMFEYDKYSKEYVKDHLYPNSTCILETKLFNDLGERFTYRYGDDVIPILNYILKYSGCFCNSGCKSLNSDKSVSRRHVEYLEVKLLLEDLAKRAINAKNQLESKIWNRAYSNLILRINHMNKLYENS